MSFADQILERFLEDTKEMAQNLLRKGPRKITQNVRIVIIFK